MARIVSLLPSATEIVCALDLGPSLVGRSHACDFPSSVAKLPVCTASHIDSHKKSADINLDVHRRQQKKLPLYSVNWDLISELKPDVIITQSQSDSCLVSYREVIEQVQQRFGSRVLVVDLNSRKLSEVWKDIERIGAALNIKDVAQRKIQAITQRVESIFKRTNPISDRPTVAAIEWIDPLMAAGNWIPELIELAGGKPLFLSAGQPSSWITWENLRKSNPAILTVFPCGFKMDRTRAEMGPLTTRSGWYDLDAVQNNRVFLMEGDQFFHRPGPRLVESLEVLAEVIHPDIFDFGHKLENWQYWGFDKVD